MTKGFYSVEGRLDKLKEVATRAEGSPFLLNGESLGGFGCGGFQKYLHKKCGALEGVGVLPISTGRFGDQKTIRRMGLWLEEYPDVFVAVPREEMLPGDVIVFKMDIGDHHIGTWMGKMGDSGGVIAHSIPRYGVSLSNFSNPMYSENAQSIWRILK